MSCAHRYSMQRGTCVVETTNIRKQLIKRAALSHLLLANHYELKLQTTTAMIPPTMINKPRTTPAVARQKVSFDAFSAISRAPSWLAMRHRRELNKNKCDCYINCHSVTFALT